MASPRRARSLFLSPEKAELLAAREINNLVNRVELVPRKATPRQGKRTDIVEPKSGCESRGSKTSTIIAVDAFCTEYRPPSVALHRLSYLDKELPPTPPSDSIAQIPNQSIALSPASTRKNAASQTVISIHSRYSTLVKPSSPSRLSIISSQERDSEDRVSLRSRYSTRDPHPVDNTISRPDSRASIGIDRRRPSNVENGFGEISRRRNTGSISPRTIPKHETVSEAVDEAVDARVPEAEEDQGTLQVIPKQPPLDTESKQVVPRSMSQRKASVGWTFHDGLILRPDNRLKSTAGTSTGDGNLEIGPESKRMIPISWSFHDGIIYKADRLPKNEYGSSKAKSSRMVPIGWSFYDGLRLRPDGSVEATLKANGKSEEIVSRSKSKRMIPIGWTFQEGLIFTTNASVQDALTSPETSGNIELEARSQPLPTAEVLRNSLVLNTDTKAEDHSKNASDNTEVATRSKSKRTVGWTFNDGLMIRSGVEASSYDGRMVNRTKSKRTVTWTFNDGIVIKARAGASNNNRNLATGAKSRRRIGWSFHDGLVIRTGGVVAKRPGQSRGMSSSTKSNGRSISWSFHDGLTTKQRSASKGKGVDRDLQPLVRSSTSKGKGKGVDRSLHPLMPTSKGVQRKRVTYSFWDGVSIRTVDASSNRVSTYPKSKIAWSFYDGINRTTVGPSNQISGQSKPKNAYGWNFYDGLTVKPNAKSGTAARASSPIRGPESIAPASQPSPQPMNQSVSHFSNEVEGRLSPKAKEPLEDIVPETPVESIPIKEKVEEPARREALPSSRPPMEPDLSPKSKPLPPSSSSSEGSYFSAQHESLETNPVVYDERQRRPPASRANTKVEIPTSDSETRYYTIEHGKAVTRDAPSQPSTTSPSRDIIPIDPKPRIRRKRLQSKPSLENWDGSVSPTSSELAAKRKQRSTVKPVFEEGISTPAPLVPKRKDVSPLASSKFHFANENAVPAVADLRPQAQALAARRKEVLAGWPSDATVDEIECVGT